MCPGASVVSYVSRAVDDLDRKDGASGTKAVPRRELTIGHAGQASPARLQPLSRESDSAGQRREECCFRMESSTLGESRDTARAMSQENVENALAAVDAWN